MDNFTILPVHFTLPIIITILHNHICLQIITSQKEGNGSLVYSQEGGSFYSHYYSGRYQFFSTCHVVIIIFIDHIILINFAIITVLSSLILCHNKKKTIVHIMCLHTTWFKRLMENTPMYHHFSVGHWLTKQISSENALIPFSIAYWLTLRISYYWRRQILATEYRALIKHGLQL